MLLYFIVELTIPINSLSLLLSDHLRLEFGGLSNDFTMLVFGVGNLLGLSLTLGDGRCRNTIVNHSFLTLIKVNFELLFLHFLLWR